MKIGRMNRVAVCVSYNKDGIIATFVVHYLQELDIL